MCGGVSLPQEMANILAQKQLRSIILTVSTTRCSRLLGSGGLGRLSVSLLLGLQFVVCSGTRLWGEAVGTGGQETMWFGNWNKPAFRSGPAPLRGGRGLCHSLLWRERPFLQEELGISPWGRVSVLTVVLALLKCLFKEIGGSVT